MADDPIVKNVTLFLARHVIERLLRSSLRFCVYRPLRADFALVTGATVPPIAVLPLLTEDDSLSGLMPKPSSCLYVLHIHASVVDATDHKSNSETAETRAMNGMRPLEREYFMAWKERNLLSLPRIE